MCSGDVGERGLSPRVRGNRENAMPIIVKAGSIPACAGEPFRLRAIQGVHRVYPRVCGGTQEPIRIKGYPMGLSPRVRGNPLLSLGAAVSFRSIPACAGEPGDSWPTSPTTEVYPRVCGGTSGTTPGTPNQPGLSPRVRGNHCLGGCQPRGWRSIPACAGEPPCAGCICRGWTVYPRVCGGTLLLVLLRGLGLGLSPRVRGNRDVLVDDDAGARSIPACAGEPFYLALLRRQSGVYPRVCGGTQAGGDIANVHPGLSPRVRGNQVVMMLLIAFVRSIPACAGEPLVPDTNPAA